MRWRPFFCALALCVAPTLHAQGPPDYSGVYLRDRSEGPPPPGTHAPTQLDRSVQELEQALEDGSRLVLQVTQTDHSIRVTRLQNGASLTSNYELEYSKSKKDRSRGAKDAGRAKFKKDALLIEYQAPWPRSGGMSFRVREKWQLSPDSRALTIRELLWGSPQRYTRQESLDSALAQASEASLMNRCSSLPLPVDNRSKYEGKAKLGFTAYQQLNTCTSFEAVLLGEFLVGLERSDTPMGTGFRKSGQLISEFPDNVLLNVTPRISECDPESLSIMPTRALEIRLPPDLMELRFRISWTGSTARALGELESDYFVEPSSDLRPPERFYRIEVPSKGVPLTDNLEVRILSKAGSQIGCIGGHI